MMATALRVFDIIGYGLMAHSPLQAKKHKFFLNKDVMVLNRDNLLVEAFKQVDELKNGYKTPLNLNSALADEKSKRKCINIY